MLTHIISDFFSVFRINNLRGSKVLYKFSYMTILCIVIILCSNHVWRDGSAWRYVAVQLSVFLPMIFSYFSAMLHPVQPTKIMYLCPMKPEERRRYIYGSYYFRIGVHMLAAVAGLCIVIFYFNDDIFSVIQVLLNHMMVAVLVNREAQADGRVCGMVIGELIFLAAVFSDIAQLSVIQGFEYDMWTLKFWFVFFCVVQLPLELWYVRYIKMALRAAISYETALR